MNVSATLTLMPGMLTMANPSGTGGARLPSQTVAAQPTRRNK
jgi:hypothetical protein